MAVFSHQRDLNREKEFEGFFDFQPAPQAVSNTMSLNPGPMRMADPSRSIITTRRISRSWRNPSEKME